VFTLISLSRATPSHLGISHDIVVKLHLHACAAAPRKQAGFPVTATWLAASTTVPPDEWGRANESWVAYQQHPAFVRDSHATDARSAVLHAPLEPSPTGAHDPVQSSAPRSADLTGLHAAEPASTPSVWMSGARRRVLQVLYTVCVVVPHLTLSLLKDAAIEHPGGCIMRVLRDFSCRILL
jgi:hypothetical protein